MRASASLRLAVAAAGGAARLAHHLGLHVASVTAWTFCPAERVGAVSGITGVSRSHLRPDLFPRVALTPDQAVAAHLAAGAHFALTGRCLSAEVE
jgi:DNA-binding transcriptional regulator YdaS (Cro superfamily)